MKKWMAEDWAFENDITEGTSEHCRLGMEQGDKFCFQYGCPEGFCPRAMTEIFTWCEVIRCGGDFIHRGYGEPYKMTLWCPCHCIQFQLTAIPINRGPDGKYIGKKDG